VHPKYCQNAPEWAEHSRFDLEDEPRRGDWEVMDVTERKLMLRCPISNREVEWNRFCYFVEEADNSAWPHRDE